MDMKLFWWGGLACIVFGVCFGANRTLVFVFGQDVDGIVESEVVKKEGAGTNSRNYRYIIVNPVDPCTGKTTNRQLSIQMAPWQSYVCGDRVSLKCWQFSGAVVLKSFSDMCIIPIIPFVFGCVFIFIYCFSSGLLSRVPRKANRIVF
jgi:hypothetical protein